MSGQKTQSRRNAPRIKIRSTEIAYLHFQSGNSGVVRDASKDGLGFQTVEPFERSQLCAFHLSVPGFRQFNLAGQITWLDETMKRGGLRVIVPADQRRTYQQWQQRLQAALQSPPPVAPRPNPDIASHRQPPANESRVSRNVLAGCVVLALCIAITAGSRFLTATRRLGDLLTHHARSVGSANAAMTAPGATAVAQNAYPAAVPDATSKHLHSRTGPNHHARRPDARLFAQAGAPPTSAHSQTGAHPSEPPFSSPAARIGSQSSPQMPAKTAAASAARSTNEALLTNRGTASMRIDQPDLPSRFQASEAAVTKIPDASSRAAPSRAIAKPPENINAAPAKSLAATSSAPPPQAAGALQAPHSLDTAKRAQSFDSQPPEPTADLEPCHLIRSVHPVYPDDARAQHVEGDVKLRVVVGTDGSVRSVVALSGPLLLQAAAMNATRQFQYTPAQLNGQPIESIQTIDIAFKLQR